ncbi:chondroitinase-B domain-containing protein [Massilia norwichensis]|uniref:Right-handed parallel beta-helix repeat-containing protein n=1 Tax=Massilia norwichensis TaxID=1442366 RepID=A0ABT2A9X4_9BURK|nr:chondroitinase-B domain-containing protein [Massilia norwichensis]MCS0591004.1 right-handed parallel beta-helix repeat-containing protein [Massilia norwichensis]
MRFTHVVLLLGATGLLALAGGLLFLQGQGITPRQLAPYIEKRSSGHNPLITGAGRGIAAMLLGLDRGDGPALRPPSSAGAQSAAAGEEGGARKLVRSGEEVRRAIAVAVPGDVIVLLPGAYRIRGDVVVTRAGKQGEPIVVRADLPGSVIIEFDAGEGFRVLAPYWRFENLTIHGVCSHQEFCEHAFHVVGGAHHFAAVNNTILDFNAHIKINGENGRFPDAGLIESNTLTNLVPRRTESAPVTPVDLVGANDWVIRRNLITDFVKAGGDRISYGAFAKGAGVRNRFEQNVVLCEQRLRGLPGQRIGLSFGGGGTGKQYCRDRKCVTEQDQGVMQANLVASCSDVGIYLNASAGTQLNVNTLVDTAGVDVRFPESSVKADGNLVDGTIRSRNGGRVHAGDNLETPIMLSYFGYHPLRRSFTAPPRHTADAANTALDLCGAARGSVRRYGAFEDVAACWRNAVNGDAR